MARPKTIGNYNRYTEEQKRAVIRDFKETDLNIYQIGRLHSVNPKTVFFWCKQAKAKKRVPQKPFNVLVSVSKNGKCHDLKEFPNISEAKEYGLSMKDKGFEVEISELR